MNPESSTPELEVDDRFVSGRWRGFWLQGTMRSKTELTLQFRNGTVTGDGYDWVGSFVLHGSYSVESGEVTWVKSYPQSHQIDYRGAAEHGQGIWGLWRIPGADRGGFQIWPESTSEQEHRSAAQEAPIDVVVPAPVSAESEQFATTGA